MLLGLEAFFKEWSKTQRYGEYQYCSHGIECIFVSLCLQRRLSFSQSHQWCSASWLNGNSSPQSFPPQSLWALSRHMLHRPPHRQVGLQNRTILYH